MAEDESFTLYFLLVSGTSYSLIVTRYFFVSAHYFLLGSCFLPINVARKRVLAAMIFLIFMLSHVDWN